MPDQTALELQPSSSHHKWWINVATGEVVDCRECMRHNLTWFRNVALFGVPEIPLSRDTLTAFGEGRDAISRDDHWRITEILGIAGWVRCYANDASHEISVDAVDLRSACIATRRIADLLGEVRLLAIDLVTPASAGGDLRARHFKISDSCCVEIFLRKGAVVTAAGTYRHVAHASGTPLPAPQSSCPTEGSSSRS